MGNHNKFVFIYYTSLGFVVCQYILLDEIVPKIKNKKIETVREGGDIGLFITLVPKIFII